MALLALVVARVSIRCATRRDLRDCETPKLSRCARCDHPYFEVWCIIRDYQLGIIYIGANLLVLTRSGILAMMFNMWYMMVPPAVSGMRMAVVHRDMRGWFEVVKLIVSMSMSDARVLGFAVQISIYFRVRLLCQAVLHVAALQSSAG